MQRRLLIRCYVELQMTEYTLYPAYLCAPGFRKYAQMLFGTGYSRSEKPVRQALIIATVSVSPIGRGSCGSRNVMLLCVGESLATTERPSLNKYAALQDLVATAAGQAGRHQPMGVQDVGPHEARAAAHVRAPPAGAAGLRDGHWYSQDLRHQGVTPQLSHAVSPVQSSGSVPTSVRAFSFLAHINAIRSSSMTACKTQSIQVRGSATLSAKTA